MLAMSRSTRFHPRTGAFAAPAACCCGDKRWSTETEHYVLRYYDQNDTKSLRESTGPARAARM